MRLIACKRDGRGQLSRLPCEQNQFHYSYQTEFLRFWTDLRRRKGGGGGMGIDGRRGVGRDGVNRGAVRGGGGRV